MYLFTLRKCDFIANDFSIERCRDISMNTRAPVCTFRCVICWSVLFPIRNTLTRHCCWLRPASARMFWISRISAWMWGNTKCCLIALFNQLWACSTGLKNGQYGGNMTTWSQDDHQLIVKAWKVARVTVLCSITWWTRPMLGDMASMMLTFLPCGATTRRTRSPNSARSLVLWVKMLNSDSSMYT